MATKDGLTVQVAERGQLYTSFDFHTWIPRDSHTTNALQAVAFFGNRILVTGENGTALYSDNGADFTYTNLQTSDWLVSVAASSNLAVAVGDNAAIYTSANGAYWRRQPLPPGNTGSKWLLSVAWGAGTFVTVGENGYIATSANGTNWVARTSPVATNLNRVAWVDRPGRGTGMLTNAFWAVGDGGHVLFSTNLGVNWHRLLAATGSNDLFAVAGNDNSRLGVGDQDVLLGIVVSNVPIWSRQSGTLPFSAPLWTYYTALWETNDNLYWLAGQSGQIVEGIPTGGLYPANTGYAWNIPYFSLRDWLWSVTTALGLYVAVGDNARVVTSQNGLDWTPEAVSFTNSVNSNTVFFAVGGDTNLLLAVGNKGSVALSPNLIQIVVTTNADGSIITNQVSSLGLAWYPSVAPTTNDLHGVCSYGSQYYVVGGNGIILSTVNGRSWTTNNSTTTAFLSSIETFPGGLVAVGDNGAVLTSPNGRTWTNRSLPGNTNWIYRVRWLNNQLIAVGENGTILTSTNAINWTARTNGVNTKAWLNDVLMVSNTVFVVGTQGALLTSTNFTNWANVGTITEKSLYGLATQSGQLIAVGIEGAILRSQIIPDVTPVNFLEFSRTDGLNLFLVAGQPDQKFTLDSSSTLTNWTTGPQLEIMDGSGTLLFLLNTGTNAPSPTFYRTKLVAP